MHLQQVHSEACPKPFDMDTLVTCLSRATDWLAVRQPARTNGEHGTEQRANKASARLTND